MKIVINPTSYGLKLTADEMEMIAQEQGYTLRQYNKGSNDTWFVGVDWEKFRATSYLVSLVEQGRLSNKSLRVVTINNDTAWYIDTDWRTYERVAVPNKRLTEEIHSALDNINTAIYYTEKVVCREDITEELNKAYRALHAALKVSTTNATPQP